MNINILNTIANKAFDVIEADVIIVLYNAENGVEVQPYWGLSCEFKSEQEMKINMEAKTVSALIKFADKNGGESIGTFVMSFNKE